MPTTVRLRLAPEIAFDRAEVRKQAIRAAGYRPDESDGIRLLKRSLDARKKPVYQLEIEVFAKGEASGRCTRRSEAEEGQAEPVSDWFIPTENPLENDVRHAPEVAIIGMGPAGLFAALRLIQLGLKPVIFERGKDVRARRRDLAKLTREHVVNPDSNYCFGEGGAGTYSDGKLYTRSLKRGVVTRVLEWFVTFGANANILTDAHPHIGTNRLPQIITNMREGIEAQGGVIHFDTRVEDIETANGRVVGLRTSKGNFPVEQVILATGHSARDVFRMFERKRWTIEAKPFALGVRVEHPQVLIDRIQYKCESRGEHLPPAAYSLVHQVEGKGVYSFCMCPGGIIAPCATEPGEIVTNGWSPSRRNNPFANSGMVVSVEEEDFREAGLNGPLAAMEFQQMVEQACWKAAGETQAAPAQRLIDFVRGVASADLPECSYMPGIVPVNLRKVLPKAIGDRLAAGFEAFGQKMKGFMTNEAVVVAPESRTSSPVRIPRDQKTLEHPDAAGLYPCGEGAGYAGGIVSAALDGIKVAERLSERVVK